MNALAAGLLLWLAGISALASIALFDGKPQRHLDELATLLLWPVAVPWLYITGVVHRRRRTCRKCGLRYHDIDALRRHQRLTGHQATTTPPKGPQT